MFFKMEHPTKQILPASLRIDIDPGHPGRMCIDKSGLSARSCPD
jgi:hypothetical protein